MKIDILGAEYDLLVCNRADDEYLKTHEVDGYCDFTSRKIRVVTDNDLDLEAPEMYTKGVIRHEIIHAFLNESGLASSWEHQPNGHEETMVDWIALQFPKLLKAFQAANAL